MRHSKTEFTDAVTSGEPDRVNAAIEEVKNADTAECAHLFVSCVREVSEYYYVDNGYQRLSVVRFLRDLYVPRIPVTYRDIFWELLCDAITDDDGRVRNAAEQAMGTVIFFADYLGQPVDPLRADLEEIADTHVPRYTEIQSTLTTAEKHTGEPL